MITKGEKLDFEPRWLGKCWHLGWGRRVKESYWKPKCSREEWTRGCTERCLSFCDAETGVFENHFWEVLAEPESFWLPDKLALNQWMVRGSRIGDCSVPGEKTAEWKERELKKRKQLAMKRSPNWQSKIREVAGTPERKFSTKQKTAFTTGLDLIKSLPSKLEGRMVVATGRPVPGEHPLALALHYQQAGLNLSSQTTHFPVLWHVLQDASESARMDRTQRDSIRSNM